MSREFTLHRKKSIRSKVVKNLIGMGFAVDSTNMLNFTFKDSVITVSPPDFSKPHHSWSFLVWSQKSGGSRPWVGGDGTTSFSANWATPEDVMETILEKVKFDGYAEGIDKTRKAFASAVAAMNEAVKHV